MFVFAILLLLLLLLLVLLLLLLLETEEDDGDVTLLPLALPFEPRRGLEPGLGEERRSRRSSFAMVARLTGPRTGVVLRIGVRLRGLDLGRLAMSW